MLENRIKSIKKCFNANRVVNYVRDLKTINWINAIEIAFRRKSALTQTDDNEVQCLKTSLDRQKSALTQTDLDRKAYFVLCKSNKRASGRKSEFNHPIGWNSDRWI
jgi:hypothetical protein